MSDTASTKFILQFLNPWPWSRPLEG